LEKKSKELINQKTIFQRALILAKLPILLAMIITPLRFSLEIAGIAENLIFLIGLLWLTLAFSVYWGIKLCHDKHAVLILLMSLIIFSPISRIPVAILWWIDTKWEIGTHYGLYFDNLGNALLNHVGYGSLVQIIPGFLLGSITIVILKKRKSVAIKNQIQ
jgi:hypothetical protein